MKYSIILPVYNVKEYLQECLDSIYSNQYDDFELICIDDGSTDGSFQWLIENESKYPRMKYVQLEHIGLSGVRNYGIQECSGDYICWIDSDDCISKNFFSTIDNILFESNCNCIQIGWTRKKDELFHEKLIDKEEIKLISKENFNREILLSKRPCYCWSIITKKQYYYTINYPIGHSFEDLNQNHHLIQNIRGDIALVQIPLYFYRDNISSIVNTINTKKRIDIFMAWEDRCKFAKEYYHYLYNECYNQFIISSYLVCLSYLKEKYVFKKDIRIFFDSFKINKIYSNNLPIYKKIVIVCIYILAYLKYSIKNLM